MRSGSRAVAALFAASLSLAACGKAQRVDAAAARHGGACTVCHGGLGDASGAPPYDTRGRTDPALPSVGAHAAHVAAGLDCGACHPKPASVWTGGHPDGRVDLSCGPLATAGGAVTPTFDEGTGACAGVYCHGAFPGGKAANAPVWTAAGTGQAACGTCHALPPPRSAGHPQRAACCDCHPGYTSSSVVAATHVDGAVQLGGLDCTDCHGDAGRLPTVLNPQLPAAPPLDVNGETVSTAVGAHQAHLTGSAVAAALACTECHAVPASLAGHPTGVVSLSWGPLATGVSAQTTSGARTVALTSSASPQYAGGACASTYCHGTYSGTYTYPVLASDPVEYTSITFVGAAASPSWTGTAACGSCHLVPPATGAAWHSGHHGGGNDCALCHPDAAGTAPGGASITDPSRHVDGRVDLAPQWVGGCLGCH